MAGLKRTLWNTRQLWRLHRRSGYRHLHPAMLVRGFLPDRRCLYDFTTWPHWLFLTDWEVESRLGTVNPAGVGRATLGDKRATHDALREVGCGKLLPPLVGVLESGDLTPAPGGPPSIEEALAVHGRLFLKAMRRDSGRRVATVLRHPDRIPHQGNYLVEANVAQHDVLAALFPDAVNTLRVLTLRDAEGPFVARTVQRIGTRESAPVDNYSRRGLVAAVGADGTLSEAASRPGPDGVQRYSTHPDTGAPIEGLQVPFFDEVHSLALRCAEVFSDLVHVGWDVAITETGPLLIEGNVGVVNPNVFQAHRPMLSDERVCAFYERHRVISHRKARRAASWRTDR